MTSNVKDIEDKVLWILNLKIKDEEYEILTSDVNIEHHVELNLYDTNDILGYYSDPKKFIQDYVTCTYLRARKSLYLILTNQRGWDTYDSAVYCAYTESEAIILSENKMGDEYKNTAEFIGYAIEDLEIGEVCSSFRAG